MISRAALAPLAPVRPLPGCVPEPQRKGRGWAFCSEPNQDGSHGEKLIECELAVKMWPPVNRRIFRIKWRDDCMYSMRLGKFARKRSRFSQQRVPVVAARVPVPFFQLEWRELNVGGEHVLAIGASEGSRIVGW